MDTSTLLIVFLLASAASLASYALSQWSWTRGGSRNLGWAATGVGTTLLLAAAAIVVIALVFRASFWQPGSAVEQALREPMTPADKTSTRRTTRSEIPAGEASESTALASPTTRSNSSRRASDDRFAFGDANEQSSRPGSSQAAQPSNTTRSAVPPPGVPVFTENDPWAATRCVHIFNPDLGDPTRWKVENECDWPVGIIVSSCGANPLNCTDRDERLLPSKAQRPVTHAEQTLHREQVRHVACFISNPLAAGLIGESSEVRSSPEWRAQIDAIRLTDGCLRQFQNWPVDGR